MANSEFHSRGSPGFHKQANKKYFLNKKYSCTAQTAERNLVQWEPWEKMLSVIQVLF